MTLQDILIQHMEDKIVDAGGVEWTGDTLEQEYHDQNFEILHHNAIVGENGRIWLFSEEGDREETGYTIGA